MSNFDDIIDANLQDIYKICLYLVQDSQLARQLTRQSFLEVYDYFENVKENMIFAELANIAWKLAKNYNAKSDVEKYGGEKHVLE